MDKKAASPAPRDAEKPKGKLVGAVANAAKILRFLRAADGPATVTQITRGTKLNPSTCFNILRTLIQEDFVQFDATAKTYQLSLGLVALARGALEHSPVLHVLKPKIEELAQRHKIMVTIWRRIGDDRIMLAAVAESDAPVRIHARAGTRTPLLLGASGRAFTAFAGLELATMKQRFQQLRLARPLDFDTYLEQLEEVRRTGWAIDDGYVYPGTITIAAPVFEPVGPPQFACAAILFNGQYDLQRVASIAEDLKRIGRTLVENLPAPAAQEMGAAPLASVQVARKAAAATKADAPRRRAA